MGKGDIGRVVEYHAVFRQSYLRLLYVVNGIVKIMRVGFLEGYI